MEKVNISCAHKTKIEVRQRIPNVKKKQKKEIASSTIIELIILFKLSI